MTLFNRKTLSRQIKPVPIPAEHLSALDAWAEMIRSDRVYALKETALHGQFAAKINEGVLATTDLRAGPITPPPPNRRSCRAVSIWPLAGSGERPMKSSPRSS